MPDPLTQDPSLIVLVGAAGSGKSTLAGAWPAHRVLELATFRELICDDALRPDATDEAVLILGMVLEARLARQLTTVVDAANTDPAMRARLLDIAERHRVPATALVLTTPLEVCLERNALRPPELRVPDDVVRRQYAQTVDAVPVLSAEGFSHVEALHGGLLDQT
ncbi:AAA family ATPase [Actinomycetota bacterium Odt1-20B]